MEGPKDIQMDIFLYIWMDGYMVHWTNRGIKNRSIDRFKVLCWIDLCMEEWIDGWTYV